MPIYEGTITFRFKAPSQVVAELYVDGLSTALRHNKPEISTPSVRWNINEVLDDFDRNEYEQQTEHYREQGLPELNRGNDPSTSS